MATHQKKTVKENTGNLEIWPKHREFGFAQVVNSLIVKVKDISIFAAKFPPNLLSWISLPSQFCVCNSHKSLKLAHGKLVVGQGKHREFW